ncbi:transposase family protein [Micromonospora sp. NPDC000663]|uniref:transposase family protein n=1 Tax=Micromonospora sp. NPDC000663 TaxID=3364218 RepID=UPI0036A2D281
MSSSLIDVIRQYAPAPSGTTPTGREAYGLVEALARVPDLRDPRGIRYPLASVLAVAVCAVMAGASTFAAIGDWVDDLDASAWGRLGFTGRVPVLTTVWRLLVRVDAETLTAVLADWLCSRLSAPPPTRQVIAVDGKVVRGAVLPEGGFICCRPTTRRPVWSWRRSRSRRSRTRFPRSLRCWSRSRCGWAAWLVW